MAPLWHVSHCVNEIICWFQSCGPFFTAIRSYLLYLLDAKLYFGLMLEYGYLFSLLYQNGKAKPGQRHLSECWRTVTGCPWRPLGYGSEGKSATSLSFPAPQKRQIRRESLGGVILCKPPAGRSGAEAGRGRPLLTGQECSLLTAPGSRLRLSGVLTTRAHRERLLLSPRAAGPGGDRAFLSLRR